MANLWTLLLHAGSDGWIAQGMNGRGYSGKSHERRRIELVGNIAEGRYTHRGDVTGGDSSALHGKGNREADRSEQKQKQRVRRIGVKFVVLCMQETRARFPSE